MIFSKLLSFLPLAGLALADSPAEPTQFGLVGPSNALLFLNGFHFINGHPDEHIEANHHCVIVTDYFIQCAVYVPNTQPARLAGIEYIVTADAFAKLPEDEKQLWHSHKYEVKSGFLIEPGLPDTVDDAVQNIIANSYGKTFNTWPYDSRNNDIPLGIPDLVAGFTGPGQLDQSVVDERDARWNVSSAEIAARRALTVVAEPVLPGADAWEDGIILTLELRNRTAKEVYGPSGNGSFANVSVAL